VTEQIADIALQNKRTVYGILFRATAETLQTIAADPSISAPKSVSLPFFTPGVRICFTIRTRIASFPAVDFHPTAHDGSQRLPSQARLAYPSSSGCRFRNRKIRRTPILIP